MVFFSLFTGKTRPLGLGRMFQIAGILAHEPKSEQTWVDSHLMPIPLLVNVSQGFESEGF